jgi:hypothetical protein
MTCIEKIYRRALPGSLLLLMAVFAYHRALGQNTMSYMQPYSVSSPTFNGSANAEFTRAFTCKVEIKGAPWLCIYFKTLALGERSYVQLTSSKDKLSQQLNTTKALQWGNSSMFFNGDAVDIELFVASNDRDVRFEISEVQVGRSGGGRFDPMAICGGDDRTTSSNPAVGRLWSTSGFPGTAWISSRHILVSAGHIVHYSLSKVEFIAPPSSSNGDPVHPGRDCVRRGARLFTM